MKEKNKKETEKSEKAEQKKGLKVLKIVGNILIWVFVAFSVLVTILVFAANNNVVEGIRVPTLGGKTVINVLTDSMDPTIKAGDIIIGQRVIDDEARSLKKDDVVTFVFKKDGENSLNTHRIIEVIDEDGDGKAEKYITKGDNKEKNVGDVSEEVLPEKVICVWNGTRFGKVGSFLNFLQTSTGFLVVIVIPLILFFLYELIRFFLALRSVKKSGKKEITAADEEEIKRKAVEEYLRQQEAERRAKEEAEKAEAEAEKARTEAEKTVSDAFSGEPEAKEPPVEEPPVEEPPVEEPPVEEPPVEEPPVEEPAVEEPAVEEPAVEEPAPEGQAAEEPAAEKPDEDGKPGSGADPE